MQETKKVAKIPNNRDTLQKEDNTIRLTINNIAYCYFFYLHLHDITGRVHRWSVGFFDERFIVFHRFQNTLCNRILPSF